MNRSVRVLILCAMIVSACSVYPPLPTAQSIPQRERAEFDSELSDLRTPAKPGVLLSASATAGITSVIAGANKTCGNPSIDTRYRIDCLRVYYGWVADDLPDTGEYLPIKEAMSEAEAKLEAIILANLDEAGPTIQPREAPGLGNRTPPPVRPIQQESVAIATAQAEAIIKEAALVILRSGGEPTSRTIHYTEIAAAVEDNLVILRST